MSVRFRSGVGVFVMMLVLVMVVAIPRARFAADVELGRTDTGTNDWLGPDGIRRNRQATEGATDVLDLHTGIDERAQNHVARRARKTVEVEDGQDLPSYRRPSRLAVQAVLGIIPVSSNEQYRRSPRMM
jgi:hypothetical protein